jgi:uncharacterized membrane protein
MSDQSVVLAVATYTSKAAADRDFDAVRGARHSGEFDYIAVAVLEKGADGELLLDRHDSPPTGIARGGGLLGGALIVIAAPVGIRFLVPLVATAAAWAGVGAIVGHFWQNTPKEQLRQMSELLEAGQAALVVVAVDHDGQEVRAALSNASRRLVTDSTSADFEADFTSAIDEASATG